MKLYLTYTLLFSGLHIFVSSSAQEIRTAKVEKQRVIVLTDITNEPDDQESLVRFLVYANEYDIEGIVATTSFHLQVSHHPRN